jgi:hypothetical protein
VLLVKSAAKDGRFVIFAIKDDGKKKGAERLRIQRAKRLLLGLESSR